MQFNIPAEFKNASGVYIIRNSVNSKVYVGSAVKLRRRYMAHLCSLNGGYHGNPHLQSFASKHGTGCMSFYLLELLIGSNEQSLIELEQKHILLHDSANRENGFNIQEILFPMQPPSEETRQRMSDRARERGISTEQRKKMQAGIKKRNEQRVSTLNIISSSCQICEINFLHHASYKRKYCSRGCYSKRVITPQERERLGTINKGKAKPAEVVARVVATKAAVRIEKHGRNCAICATLFVPQSGNNDAKFCSRLCFYKYLSLHGSPKKSPESERKRICACCGGTYLVSQSKKAGKFCSKECQYKTVIPPNKSSDVDRQCICQHCGASFLVNSPSQKKTRRACSLSCGASLAAASRNARKAYS